jgi:hypothetical protein
MNTWEDPSPKVHYSTSQEEPSIVCLGSETIKIMSFADLLKFDDLEDPKGFWPAKLGTKG